MQLEKMWGGGAWSERRIIIIIGAIGSPGGGEGV